MHLGQTSFRLTSRLAAGRGRRKLRDDLTVSRQVVAGETSYVVKIPDTGAYLRYTALMWGILSSFDGTRTDGEVLAELSRTLPELGLSAAELEDVVDGAEASLWERTITDRNLALLERIRGERRTRARARQGVFHLSFSAWDPHRFFARIVPWLSWVWTPAFVGLSLALFAAGGALFVADHERIFRDTAHFYAFREQSAAELLDFWILLLVVSFVHECAHGLTGTHFGGEVRQMGFMLIYFTPAFYTDVSDIYLFDRDAKRVWTILAGVWVETLLCAAALLTWSLTPPGTALGYWSYKLMLMTSITGVLFNLNPLMKFDGYYLLCQLLKIDNLREDSFAYLGQWARHVVSGGRVPVEKAARRKHRIFLLFGLLAFAYSLLVTTLVVLFVKNVATAGLGDWGYLLAAGFVWMILRRRLSAIRRSAAALVGGVREALMRWSGAPRAAVAAAAIVLLVLPTRLRVTSEFVLEPGTSASVRAAVPGFLSEVAVEDGQALEAGAVVGRLRDPDLEARGVVLACRLRLAERRLLAAQGAGDEDAAREWDAERRRATAEHEQVRARLAALVLRAPVAGTVAAPAVQQRAGEYLREGDELALVADRSVMRARVLVRDAEVEDVSPGAPVRLKVNAFPLQTFDGRVGRVLPAAAADRLAAADRAERDGQDLFNYFAVTLEFQNPGGQLREGMTGTAKIYGRRFSPALRALRSAWRWARSQVFF